MRKTIAFQSHSRTAGNTALSRVGVPHIPPIPIITEELIERWGKPKAGLPKEVNDWRKGNLDNLYRKTPPLDLSGHISVSGSRGSLSLNVKGGLTRVEKARLAQVTGTPTFYGTLGLTVIRGAKFDEEQFERYGVRIVVDYEEALNYGLASAAVVTDDGVAYITDGFTNAQEIENLNYHGIGTGTQTEDVTETALQTELTTQYNPNSTRATGTQDQPSANIYRTIGTNAVDASVAITEHGILSQAATGGGTLLDRSEFAAINLGSGDSLQSTYSFTSNAGG